MVKKLIQSALKTVVFSKSKLLYNKIQTMFDHAIIINTNNALFLTAVAW